jgi:predicted nucleic acid-binding protein
MVRTVEGIDASLALDEGEAAAIALAKELHADRLLIDERQGRAVAQSMGLAVAGTLAVLQDAAAAGFIDLQAAIDSLRQTTFRASPELFSAVLAAARKRSQS